LNNDKKINTFDAIQILRYAVLPNAGKTKKRVELVQCRVMDFCKRKTKRNKPVSYHYDEMPVYFYIDKKTQ